MAEGEQHHWTGENYELELSKFLLSQENMALRSEMQSLRQALNEATKLIDDLEEICRVSVVMDVPTCTCTERNNLRELKLEEKHRQDFNEKVTTIKRLESLTEEHLATIEELRTENKRLEVQLWKALVFGGPHVDGPMAEEQLPHSNVEFSDVEKEKEEEEEEEEKEEKEEEEEEEEEEEIKQEVQTKSWWRRQINKVAKGMGTFRQHFRCCLGTRKRRVV